MKEPPEIWSSDAAPMSSTIGVHVEECSKVTFEVYDEITNVWFEDGVTTLDLALTDQALIKSALLLCQAVRAMLHARGLPTPKELGREST